MISVIVSVAMFFIGVINSISALFYIAKLTNSFHCKKSILYKYFFVIMILGCVFIFTSVIHTLNNLGLLIGNNKMYIIIVFHILIATLQIKTWEL